MNFKGIYTIFFIAGVLSLQAIIQEKKETKEHEIDVAKLIKKLGLNEKEKKEWIKLVGEKLQKEPELLTREERKALAEHLLNDKDISKQVELKKYKKKRANEDIWFFIALLKHDERDPRYYSGRILGKGICDLLEPKDKIAKKIAKKIADGLLSNVYHEDTDTRYAAIWGLWFAASHLRGKYVEKVAKILVDKLNDKKVKVRCITAETLGELRMEKKLHDWVLEALNKTLRKYRGIRMNDPEYKKSDAHWAGGGDIKYMKRGLDALRSRGPYKKEKEDPKKEQDNEEKEKKTE